MPSRKYAVLRTALLNHNKNWLLCFHNKDADDGKKSNDLISLQPKWDKNSCLWPSRFSRGHLVGSDSHQPTIVFITAWKAPADTLWNQEEPPQRARRSEEAGSQSQISSLMDAQMKSSCELFLAQAKLPLQSKADNPGLFQVHITPHPGWIPPLQAKPCSFSFHLRAEGLFLNSILLEWLTAFLGVASKNCVCAL